MRNEFLVESTIYRFMHLKNMNNNFAYNAKNSYFFQIIVYFLESRMIFELKLLQP